MNRVEHAVSCFEKGFSCSQALFSTYGPQFGVDRDTALKISGVFGGGLGRMGETCGAVTGGFMVIGLKYGNTRAKDKQTEKKAYILVKEFVDKFKSRNGSIICRELLDCDISTPEGREHAKRKKLFAALCPKFVQDAAEIIEDLLE